METRFGYRKTQVVNPVMALGMKQDAVVGAGRTTHHARDAMVKAPPRESGDFCMARRAEAALFIPEIAKDTRTPKRVLHTIRFAFFEVGFIGRIVGVRVAFNLDMSLVGGVTGQQQPHFVWLPLVIVRFPCKGPIHGPVPRKVLLLEPAQVFVWVPSSGPSPQTREDFVIHANKQAFN